MADVLILFEGESPPSRKLALHVAHCVREREALTRVVPLEQVTNDDFDWQDAVVVVAPMVFGQPTALGASFFARLGDVLSGLPTGLLVVDDAAASPAASVRAAARQRAIELGKAGGFEPTALEVVGGTLDYPACGPLERRALKRTAQTQGLPTDTSRAHELTDFSVVDAFATEFLDALPGVARRKRAMSMAPLLRGRDA